MKSQLAGLPRRGGSDGGRASDTQAGRTPCLVGFTRPHLGQLLEYGTGRCLRSVFVELARVEASWKRACVRGLGRFLRSGMAERLVHQLDRTVRSGQRAL